MLLETKRLTLRAMTLNTFGDAPESSEGAGGDSLELRRGELSLVEKFGKVKDFVDLVFWEGLDKLVGFFGGCHDF